MDIDLRRLIAYVQDGAVPRWFEEDIEDNMATIKREVASGQEHTVEGKIGKQTITVTIRGVKPVKPKIWTKSPAGE
jgi:hypothetical protein